MIVRMALPPDWVRRAALRWERHVSRLCHFAGSEWGVAVAIDMPRANS